MRLFEGCFEGFECCKGCFECCFEVVLKDVLRLFECCFELFCIECCFEGCFECFRDFEVVLSVVLRLYVLL